MEGTYSEHSHHSEAEEEEDDGDAPHADDAEHARRVGEAAVHVTGARARQRAPPAASPAAEGGGHAAAALSGAVAKIMSVVALTTGQGLGGAAAAAASASAPVFDLIKAHVGADFDCVASLLMLQLGIIVFARRGAVRVDDAEVKCKGTGLLGFAPNKGGVVCRLRVNGTTRLVLVASHLAAHMKHVDMRSLHAVEIANSVRMLPAPLLDFDVQADHTIWMGDLNYRVDLAITRGADSKRNVDDKDRFAEVQALLQGGGASLAPLLAADQLRDEMRAGRAFSGFSEADISFMPTFKVRREAGLAYNPQRVSSWCDRVLFKSLPALKADLRCVAYGSFPSIATSDHKPVAASFELSCRRQTAPFVPFPSAAATEALPGALLRVRNLRGYGLLGLDLSGLSDPFVIFRSDLGDHGGAAALRGLGHDVPRTEIVPQTVTPKWAECIEMKIAATSAAMLDQAHLFLVVMDYDSSSAPDRMGQAVLPLAAAARAGGSPVPFDVVVTKGTRAHGHLLGEIECVFGASMAARGAQARTCCAVA
jgi:hypothetical protein